MLAARQQLQAGADICLGLGLGQDAAANSHHRICRQHEIACQTLAVARALALLHGQPQGKLARPLVAQRRFVDVGWGDQVRPEADLPEKVKPSWARAGKRKPGAAPAAWSLEAVGDAALGQVVGRHLDEHLVARQDADAVFPHFPGRMPNDFMVVAQLHAKSRVGQKFHDRAFKLDKFFLRHATPFGVAVHLAGPLYTVSRGFVDSLSFQLLACSAQTSVNSRRAVSKSTSALSASRSVSTWDPSLCSPRRPISIASICEGVELRIAS